MSKQKIGGVFVHFDQKNGQKPKSYNFVTLLSSKKLPVFDNSLVHSYKKGHSGVDKLLKIRG